MAFSSALTLTDLNDYLGPSQACIKPVSGKDVPSIEDPKVLDETAVASTEIAIEDGVYYESAAKSSPANTLDSGPPSSKPRERTRLETAEISLNDCLACSGCVTSAESVLIGLQSVDELRKIVATKGQPEAPTHLIASISPQSLASLSAKYGISTDMVLRKVELYLKINHGFAFVSDTSFARHISLDEQAREYVERKRKAKSQRDGPVLPMLASACPGWICYAEKTHGELLPLISRTRSPQQMAGLLAKRYIVESGTNESRIYHMTVMPCYDKKLEASRQDFFDDVTKTRDVDLVITTGELDEMMRSDDIVLDKEDVEQQTSESPITPPDSERSVQHGQHIPSLLSQPGSSSGSYLFDLIRRVWRDHTSQIDDSNLQDKPNLSVTSIRSADYTEYVLRSSSQSGSEILFKGAQCYGFRNLQNVVRKVQKQTGIRSKKSSAALVGGEHGLTLPGRRGLRGTSARGGMVKRGGRGGNSAMANGSLSRLEDEEERGYDFIEVMACPGGCVNGGGQVRPPGGEAEAVTSSSLTSRTINADITEALIDGASHSKVPSGSSLTKTVKMLDPEGFTDGWLTPNSSSSISGDDIEMKLDTLDEPEVKGWKGTAKEWVRQVEKAYWQTSKRSDESDETTPTSVHYGQALGLAKEQIGKEIASALASLVQEPSKHTNHLDALANIVVEHICRSRGREESRSSLLRTQYRTVQDEAVSGLAVQW